jgi:hypothetical protein
MMKILKDKVRTMRRKAQSWLGILVYDSARGQVDRGVFTERLKATIGPVLNLKYLQAIVKIDPPRVYSEEASAAIKKTLLRRQTSDKYRERITMLNEIRENASLDERMENSKSPNIFATLTLNWAKIMGQNMDFAQRVSERFNELFEEWQKETGCHDFSDLEVTEHPQEYGNFLAGFTRILLEETPNKDISNSGEFFRQAIQEVSEEDFNGTIQKAIVPISSLITRETEAQLTSALKANPEAKNKITSPEVEALVEWEKGKQGWGGDTNKAIKLLGGSLTSDSKMSNDQVDRATIFSSLKMIGKRSILVNLKDAIKGQLKVRLIDCALRWLEKCLLQKPRIIWNEREGGNEVYKILMKGCEDGKG